MESAGSLCISVWLYLSSSSLSRQERQQGRWKTRMAWRGSKLRPSAASGFAEAGALFAFNIQYLEEKYSRVESQVSVDEQEVMLNEDRDEASEQL